MTLKSVATWLIRKLGGVPFEEFERVVEIANREAREKRETLKKLIESEERAKKAEGALTTFIDRIKIDPDGYYRPALMNFPMGSIKWDERIDEAHKVIAVRAVPRTIAYNVVVGFGEPEGLLLHRMTLAADVVGQAVAKSIKIAFGIEVAEMAVSD